MSDPNFIERKVIFDTEINDQDLYISLDYGNYRLQPFADTYLTQDLKMVMKF